MTEMELLRQIGDVEDTCIAEMYEYIARNSKRRSPRPFLLAAIIVVLMLGITVAASGAVRWEGDTWFDHFFVTGSSETDAGAITE